MTTDTFDTLEAMQNLQLAGVPEKQAQAMVNTIKSSIGSGVATKADIANLRADMMQAIKNSQIQTMIWVAVVVGLGFAAFGWFNAMATG